MSTRNTPQRRTCCRLESGGLEDRGDVLQHLLGLLLDVGRERAGGRIAAGLAGHEHEVAEDHAG